MKKSFEAHDLNPPCRMPPTTDDGEPRISILRLRVAGDDGCNAGGVHVGHRRQVEYEPPGATGKSGEELTLKPWC